MTTAILITDAFPLGSITETAFVVPEIEALAKAFARVIVIPTTALGPADAIPLPPNVEICRDWVESPLWRQKWRRALYLFTPGLWRRCGSPRTFTNLTFTAASIAFERWFLHRFIKGDLDLKDTVIETFWFDFPTAALGHMRKHIPSLRYVSRAHGHDIYTDRALKPRAEAIDQSQGIYCVSGFGADYLKKLFPGSADKIHSAPIGCTKLLPAHMAAGHKSTDRQLTFMSIARVAPGKGVGRILEMLRKLAVARPSTSIRWIHIGDGPLMSVLKSATGSITETNLSVELRGTRHNPEVQRMLTAEPIDWMMLLSDSEGLPISLCEGMAYGIPAIATDVGGVSQLVDDDCGLLLPPDCTPEEFVRGLLPYLDSDVRMDSLRRGAFEKWKRHFNAPALRHDFVARHLLPQK